MHSRITSIIQKLIRNSAKKKIEIVNYLKSSNKSVIFFSSFAFINSSNPREEKVIRKKNLYYCLKPKVRDKSTSIIIFFFSCEPGTKID